MFFFNPSDNNSNITIYPKNVIYTHNLISFFNYFNKRNIKIYFNALFFAQI